MRLSEAIREGAKVTEPAERRLLEEPNKACAFGAALVGKLGWDAAWGEYFHDGCRTITSDLIKKYFSPLSWATYDDVMYRNDCTTATREQIADWLESEGL